MHYIMNAETAKCPLDTQKLIEICRQNDVVKLGVFGSMARGEAGEQSDIDLLVNVLEESVEAAVSRRAGASPDK